MFSKSGNAEKRPEAQKVPIDEMIKLMDKQLEILMQMVTPHFLLSQDVKVHLTDLNQPS